MSETLPTRPRDREQLVKMELRRLLGIYALTAAQFADMVDESDDTVEQWLSPNSRVNVPARVLCAPRLHRGVRRGLIKVFDDMVGDPIPHGAESLEAHAGVVVHFAGNLLSILVKPLARANVSSATAAQIMATARPLAEALDAFDSLCLRRVRDRVTTGALPAAKGGPS